MLRRSRAAVALALTLVLALWVRAADAHSVGLSTGEYTAKGASVVAKVAFARTEVAALLPGVDGNRDGHLSAAEIEGSKSVLVEKILRRIRVTTGGAECGVTLTDAGLTEEDGLLMGARWDCPTDGQPFELEMALLDDLARGHRHIARAVSGKATHDEVLFASSRRLTIPPAPVDASSPPPPAAKGGSTFGSFFVLGIEHILTGYDHLVFLFGLVLLRARLRALLGVVTAFTVAHSISLALAVLDVWSPSPRLVEPAIALSIAWIGIENMIRVRGTPSGVVGADPRGKDANRRWRITFPFGLVHGFGFAGALREVGLPRSAVPAALLSFNLGVESGQLAVLVVLLPVLFLLRRQSWFEPWGVRIASGAVAAAGLLWFVARVSAP